MRWILVLGFRFFRDSPLSPGKERGFVVPPTLFTNSPFR